MISKSYFEMIRYMRTADYPMYQLYRRIGAQIVPDHPGFEGHALPAEWRDGPRMAAGMVHFPERREDKESGMLENAFMSFMKKKQYLGFKPPKGSSIYEMTLYWFEAKHDRIISANYHVMVDERCHISIFKQPRTVFIDLPPRHRGSHRGPAHFCKSTWDYGLLPLLLEDNKARNRFMKNLKDITVEDYARLIFCLGVNTCYASGDGFQVRVRKDNLVARFNIAMLRTPYFFKERDKTVTVNGLTKPIFHIVRAHRRITAGGHERYVRSHFRGERRFSWKGYHVSVSMPGWHHPRVEEFDVASETFPLDAAVPSGYQDTAWLGDLVNKLYEGRKPTKRL